MADDSRDNRPGKWLAEYLEDAHALDPKQFCQRHGQWFFVHHQPSSPIKASDSLQQTKVLNPWDDPVDTESGCEKPPARDLRFDVFQVHRKSDSLLDHIAVGRVASADVLIPDSHVSKFHAKIRRGPDGSMAIEDAGSKNGTFVNGRRIPSTKDKGAPARLESGMCVRFGDVELTLLSAADFCALCIKSAGHQP